MDRGVLGPYVLDGRPRGKVPTVWSTRSQDLLREITTALLCLRPDFFFFIFLVLSDVMVSSTDLVDRLVLTSA